MQHQMNPKVLPVFKAWLALDEDEKRDFVKEMLRFNNLTASEKKAMIKELKL